MGPPSPPRSPPSPSFLFSFPISIRYRPNRFPATHTIRAAARLPQIFPEPRSLGEGQAPKGLEGEVCAWVLVCLGIYPVWGNRGCVVGVDALVYPVYITKILRWWVVGTYSEIIVEIEGSGFVT